MLTDLTPVWIGLGVGVPLLVILCVTVAVAVVLHVQRYKRFAAFLVFTQEKEMTNTPAITMGFNGFYRVFKH